MFYCVLRIANPNINQRRITDPPQRRIADPPQRAEDSKVHC